MRAPTFGTSTVPLPVEVSPVQQAIILAQLEILRRVDRIRSVRHA